MRTNRQLTFGVLGLLAMVALAAALFIWPNYREARSVRAQVYELDTRLAGLGDRAHAVDRLAQEVQQNQRHVQNDLKIIPEAADVAGLIRKLSYPIDGVSVTDQTFTAGSPADAMVSAAPAGNVPTSGSVASALPQAMPVTAEMTATFESVLGLIDTAESMKRLVRVASVRISCKREEQKADVPLLKASIGLEVIYDPIPAGATLASGDGAREVR